MKTFKQLMEGLQEALWPGTPEYEAKFGKAKGFNRDGDKVKRGNRHDIETKDGVTRATRRYDDNGETSEPEVKDPTATTGKRGRGRPPGKYGSYKKKVKESLEIIEGLDTEEEIQSFVESLDEESFLELQAFLESEELEEAAFAPTMKKALDAHERGDTAKVKYHLGNAKTARYAMKSTEISKHKDLLDKYKELRDKYVSESEEDEAMDNLEEALKTYNVQVGHPNGSRTVKVQAKSKNHAVEVADKEHKKFGERVNKYSVEQIKEKAEPVEELSKGTLGSYIKAASHDVAAKGAATRQFTNDAHAKRDANDFTGARKSMERADKTFAKSWKRREGMAKAVDRLTKEDVEQIEELSKDTLKSYVKNASTSVHNAAFKSGEKHAKGDYTGMGKDYVKSYKRQLNIGKAVDKLTKEDVEQIEELSKGTLTSYYAKAIGDRHSKDLARDSAKRRGDEDSAKKLGDKVYNRSVGLEKAKDKFFKEEVEQIEEAVKLGSKVVIHAPGKSYHGKVGHVGEIRHGAYKGAPKTYTVDYDHNPETGRAQSIQLDKKNVKLHTESVEQIDEMKAGKEYSQEHIMSKIRSGDWEAQTDVKPGKHVELRHHTGKKVTVQVKPESNIKESLSVDSIAALISTQVKEGK